MKTISILGPVALGVLATALIPSAGFSTSSYSIGISAHVPLSCQVDLQPGDGGFTGSVTRLGTTREFCNSARGYTLYGLPTGNVDGAKIVVDGREFPLRAGQEFVMVSTSGPDQTGRTILYDAGETDGGGNLSVRIQAK